jgi:hypothetical protein
MAIFLKKHGPEEAGVGREDEAPFYHFTLSPILGNRNPTNEQSAADPFPQLIYKSIHNNS